MNGSRSQRNIRDIHGNITRIDPVAEIYPLYTSYAATQYPNISNGSFIPILPMNDVINSKESVDNTHL